MSPIEILGTLLRKSSGGGGMGGKILSDILGGGRQAPEEEVPEEQAPPARSHQSRSSAPEPSHGGSVLDAWRRESANPPQPTISRPTAAARPAPSPKWNGGQAGILRPPAPAPVADQDEEAVYLIRAMINAARADGEMDAEEEQKILGKLGQPSQEVLNFIRAEFAKPLDVREFAWSIPLGLEEKIYALSLSVMEMDTRAESGYLSELAHGLRLSPDICQQLHQQLGAPAPGQ